MQCLWFVRDIRRYTNVFWYLIDWLIDSTRNEMALQTWMNAHTTRLSAVSCATIRTLSFDARVSPATAWRTIYGTVWRCPGNPPVLSSSTHRPTASTGSRRSTEPLPCRLWSTALEDMSSHSVFQRFYLLIRTGFLTCLCGSLAQCALSLKRLSAGPGFNPQTRQNKLFQDYWRSCFEINFSCLTVSSIICDR